MTILTARAKRQLGNELKEILGEGTSELGVLPFFYGQLKVILVDGYVHDYSAAELSRLAKYFSCPALDNSHLRTTIGDSKRYWKDVLNNFVEKYLKMERMQ